MNPLKEPPGLVSRCLSEVFFVGPAWKQQKWIPCIQGRCPNDEQTFPNSCELGFSMQENFVLSVSEYIVLPGFGK